jgi:O-antigen ligase
VSLAQWTLLLLLMAGPLCFGALEPWSLLLLEVGSVVVLLLWIVLCWRSARVRLDPPTIVLLLFGCLIVFQIWTGASAYTYASQQELLKIAAYFLCFLLARQLFLTSWTRRLPAASLTIFGALLATFSVVQKLQGNGLIYWLRASSTPTFFGPYANKNHYAGLLEMIIPFALLGAARLNASRSQRVLFAFSASVMIASVFLSGSRSGSAVVFFEIIAFVVIVMPASRAGRIRVASALLATVFGIALVIWIAGGALIDQAAALHDPMADASVINRRQLTRDSLELVRQRPILGWGLGTFLTVYPQVSTWYGDSLVNAAHDDYLQLLVETGAAGLGLMLIFVGLVLHVGIRRFSRAPTGVVSAAILGCCGLLLHSFSDFNLHVPANAAMFFSLCGLICAAQPDRNESFQ